jgi:hypothetical protein
MLAALFNRVKSSARQGLGRLIVATELLGMPLEASLAGLRRRVLARALYGSEFLIVRGDMQKRLNA